MKTEKRRSMKIALALLILCLSAERGVIGATWETGVIDSSGDVGAYCELVRDASGNMHAGYLRRDTNELMAVSSIGAAWQTPEKVDSTGSVYGYCSITLTGAGERKISFYRSGTNTLIYAGPESPLEWETGAVTSSGDDIGIYCSALYHQDGVISVSCRNESEQSLVLVEGDTSGVWSTAQTIDPGPNRGAYSDHVYIPYMGYAFSEYDGINHSLIYVDSIRAPMKWDLGIVSERFETGRYVSSCLAPDGRIASAFYSYGELTLGSVHISGTNELGNSVVKGVVDSIAGSESSDVYIDLEVTPEWDWHISYRNTIDGFLYYAFADSNIITSTEEDGDEDTPPPAPPAYHLYQNAPNPFNPLTKIMFDLPRAVDVKLTIYNVRGERVATLIDRHMSAGRKTAIWDGKNSSGSAVASGIYFYRLSAGHFAQARKMVLLR